MPELSQSNSIQKIYNEKLLSLGISNSDIFLSESSTHYKRVSLAQKIGHPIEKINKLTAFFDFMRVPTMKAVVAEVFVKLGVKGVQELRTKNDTIFFDEIMAQYPYVLKSISLEYISDIISKSNETPLRVFDLWYESFAVKNKGYASSISSVQQQFVYLKKESKHEFITLIIQSVIFLILGFISLYFLVFIPILFIFHFYRNSFFISKLHYTLREKLESYIFSHQLGPKSWLWLIQENFNFFKKTMCLWIIALLCIVFLQGLLTGNIERSVASSLSGYRTSSQKMEHPYYLKESVYNNFDGKVISREALVGILLSNQDIKTDSGSQSCFGDISESIYKEQICFAKRKGYIQGDAFNNFNPTDTVSHAAGLKFILNFNGENVPSRAAYITFDDLEKRFWYTTYAEYAKIHGLIPESERLFYPDEAITINQVDTYIYKLVQKK